MYMHFQNNSLFILYGHSSKVFGFHPKIVLRGGGPIHCCVRNNTGLGPCFRNNVEYEYCIVTGSQLLLTVTRSE